MQQVRVKGILIAIIPCPRLYRVASTCCEQPIRVRPSDNFFRLVHRTRVVRDAADGHLGRSKVRKRVRTRFPDTFRHAVRKSLLLKGLR